MSAIDDEITKFYDEMMSLRMNIHDCEKWMAEYREKRLNYPSWVTNDGRLIMVEEIEDSHLDNLIPFIKRTDPSNDTHWLDVFNAEKRYRQLKDKLSSMKAELMRMEYVEEQCL